MFARTSFNPKRRFKPLPLNGDEVRRCEELAAKVAYSGSPYHKRNPGDFGLTPPAHPRLGATLCDDAGLFKKTEVLELLQLGIRLGMISDRDVEGWPKNVWVVTPEGVALEAQFERPGVYHGYPVRDNDPFREQILAAWTNRQKS